MITDSIILYYWAKLYDKLGHMLDRELERKDPANKDTFIIEHGKRILSAYQEQCELLTVIFKYPRDFFIHHLNQTFKLNLANDEPIPTRDIKMYQANVSGYIKGRKKGNK